MSQARKPPVLVPAWVLAALIQDCRAYGLCGKYLDQAEGLLEAWNAADARSAVEAESPERGPTRVLVAVPAHEDSCHGTGGEPCARLSDTGCCSVSNDVRPCWESPSIIWREVK
jgi:hypothetical protein